MKIFRGNNSEIINIDTQIGRLIRQCRILKGFNQTEMAFKLGFSLQQVQKYENGNNRLSVGTVIFIAHKLNLDLEELISYDLIWGKQAAGNLAYCTQKNKVGDGRTQRYQLEIIRALGEIDDLHIQKAMLRLIRNINDKPDSNN